MYWLLISAIIFLHVINFLGWFFIGYFIGKWINEFATKIWDIGYIGFQIKNLNKIYWIPNFDYKDDKEGFWYFVVKFGFVLMEVHSHQFSQRKIRLFNETVRNL